MRISPENFTCQYPLHEINNRYTSYDKELLNKIKATSLPSRECEKFSWQAEHPSPALQSFDAKATDDNYLHHPEGVLNQLYKTTGGTFSIEARMTFYLHKMYETESGRRMLNYAVEQREIWSLQATDNFQSDMVNQITGIPDEYDFSSSGYPEIRFYFHELVHRCTGLNDKDGEHSAGPICLMVNRIMAELIVDGKMDATDLESHLVFRTEYNDIESCDGQIQYMFKVDKSDVLTDEEIKNNAESMHSNDIERNVYIENKTRERNALRSKLNREYKTQMEYESFSQYKIAEDMHQVSVEREYKNTQDVRSQIEKTHDEKMKYESRENKEDFNVLHSIAMPAVSLTHMIYDSFEAIFGTVNVTSIESLILEGILIRNLDVPAIQVNPIQAQSLAEQVTELIEQIKELRKTDPGKALELVKKNIDILEGIQKKMQEDARRLKEINNEMNDGENPERQANVINQPAPEFTPAPMEVSNKKESKVVKIESDKAKVQRRGFIFPPNIGDDTAQNVVMHNVKNVMNNKEPHVVFLKSKNDLDKFNKDKDILKKEYKSLLTQAEKQSQSKNKTKNAHEITFAKGVLSTIEKIKATIGNGEKPLQGLNVSETKLYINGHGEAGTDGIFHKVGNDYVKTTTDEVVKILKDKGLPMNYQDVRLLACHTASSKKIDSFDDNELTKSEKDRTVTKKSMNEKTIKISAVKTFAENMHKNGFNQSEITGYYGKGKVKPQVKKGGGYYSAQEAETGKPERRSQYKVKYGIQTTK